MILLLPSVGAMMKPHPELRTARTTTAQAAGWADQLEALFALIHARFPRAEPRQHARAYLKGLLAPVERNNGWQLAEAAGDATPYAIQHLLGRAQWSADEIRADLQQYVTHHLGDPEAVLIIRSEEHTSELQSH